MERAIKNALDSPLLYGNDITKARRILFNIYSSDEAPVMVPEMQEIDEFFDQLDPNIEVIWGISTDNSLGEDVKVTILATEMKTEYGLGDESTVKDDSDYEALIAKLYKPAVKPIEKPVEEPVFKVSVPEDPEPAIVEKDERPDVAPPSPLQGIKRWLNKYIQDVVE